MLAKNKSTGEFFAMKRLKKSDIIKLRQVDHVISENTILADIEHPFLVSYDFNRQQIVKKSSDYLLAYEHQTREVTAKCHIRSTKYKSSCSRLGTD